MIVIYLWHFFPFCVEGIPKDFTKLHKTSACCCGMIGPNSQVMKVKCRIGYQAQGNHTSHYFGFGWTKFYVGNKFVIGDALQFFTCW